MALSIRSLPCLAILVAILPGCAGGKRTYEKVPVAKVSGKLLEKGQPIVRAKIAFHPLQPKTNPPLIPAAVTDENGAFSLTTYENSDGAPLGEYRVTVQCLVLMDPKAKGMQLPVDKYQGRYSDPLNSRWTITVKDGENALEPFDVGGS